MKAVCTILPNLECVKISFKYTGTVPSLMRAKVGTVNKSARLPSERPGFDSRPRHVSLGASSSGCRPLSSLSTEKHIAVKYNCKSTYRIVKHFRQNFRSYHEMFWTFANVLSRVSDQNPHHFGKLDSDPHQSEKPVPDPHKEHYKSCSLIVFMLVRLLLAGKSLPALSTREHDLKNGHSVSYLRILRLFWQMCSSHPTGQKNHQLMMIWRGSRMPWISFVSWQKNGARKPT